MTRPGGVVWVCLSLVTRVGWAHQGAAHHGKAGVWRLIVLQ